MTRSLSDTAGDLQKLVEVTADQSFDLGYRACLNDLAHGVIRVEDEASWDVGLELSRARYLKRRDAA